MMDDSNIMNNSSFENDFIEDTPLKRGKSRFSSAQMRQESSSSDSEKRDKVPTEPYKKKKTRQQKMGSNIKRDLSELKEAQFENTDSDDSNFWLIIIIR